jgi:hypothetical protein
MSKSELPNKMPWDCVHNFLPAWVHEAEEELLAVMDGKDKDQMMIAIDRYNDLSDKENQKDPKFDATELYGVDNEKEELMAEIIGIYTKYRQEAEKLKKQLQ